MSQEEINALSNRNSDDVQDTQVDWDLVEIIESERGRTMSR